MQYLIALLEGIVTFVSPCLLPMLPVYILYFGGQPTSQQTNQSNDSTPPPDAAPSSTDNQKSDIVPSNSDTDATAKANKKKPDSVAENALGFVFGFTIVFVLMGAFDGGIVLMIR